MKARLLRLLIEWLNKQYPYVMREVVIGHGHHIHKNPKPKATAVVNFPQPGVSGTDE